MLTANASDLFFGLLVSFFNFGIHAVTTALIVVASRRTEMRTHHLGLFVRLTALLTVSVSFLMFAHIIEIGVWAASLDAMGVAIVNIGTFEFAFENYTALGYGDALPKDVRYRLLGPIMALNGLLLIGWSVAVIFEVMRMAEFEVGKRPKRSG
jgi:Ion channel